jgi:DNA primase
MKPFTGHNHGRDKILLELDPATTLAARPIEVHIKQNGALDEGPSLAIVMKIPGDKGFHVYGEISIDMFNKGLADIGYQITPITEDGIQTQ